MTNMNKLLIILLACAPAFAQITSIDVQYRDGTKQTFVPESPGPSVTVPPGWTYVDVSTDAQLRDAVANGQSKTVVGVRGGITVAWPSAVKLPPDFRIVALDHKTKPVIKLTEGFAVLSSRDRVDGLKFVYDDPSIPVTKQPQIFNIPNGTESVEIIACEAVPCGNFLQVVAGPAKSTGIRLADNVVEPVAYFAWAEDSDGWEIVGNNVKRHVVNGFDGQNLWRAYRTKNVTATKNAMWNSPKSCFKLGGVENAEFFDNDLSALLTTIACGPNPNDSPSSRTANVHIHHNRLGGNVMINGNTDGIEVDHNAVTMGAGSPYPALEIVTVDPTAWPIGSVDVHENTLTTNTVWIYTLKITSPAKKLRITDNRVTAGVNGATTITIMPLAQQVNFDWSCSGNVHTGPPSIGEQRMTIAQWNALPQVAGRDRSP